MRGRKRDRGFVLVSVIWITGLVAVLSLTFSIEARVHMGLGRNAVANAQAEALADGGVMLAVRALHETDGRFIDVAGNVDGSNLAACRTADGAVVATRVADEGGKVDLNTASEELIDALLKGLGFSASVSERLRDALLDYRDADRNRRRSGAEAADYAAAGRAGAPRNGPLESIGELAGVLGYTPDVVSRLAPFVTVHSGQTGLDPKLTSPVLRSLIHSGQRGVFATSGLGGDDALDRRFRGVSARRAFTVTVLAVTPGGGRFVRSATFTLLPVPAGPSRRRAGEGSRNPPQRPVLPVKFWAWSQLPEVDPLLATAAARGGKSAC